MTHTGRVVGCFGLGVESRAASTVPFGVVGKSVQTGNMYNMYSKKKPIEYMWLTMGKARLQVSDNAGRPAMWGRRLGGMTLI
jgi:hypothetical protein